MSLRFPNDVIEAVDEVCAESGESRTGWVMDACRRKLDNRYFAETFETVVETKAPIVVAHLPRRSEVTPRWKKGMTK